MADADGDSTDDGPREIRPDDIDPAGGMIAVAFTGAVVAFVGVGAVVFVGDVGFVLLGLGLLVALSSPAAYLRLRRRGAT